MVITRSDNIYDSVMALPSDNFTTGTTNTFCMVITKNFTKFK